MVGSWNLHCSPFLYSMDGALRLQPRASLPSHSPVVQNWEPQAVTASPHIISVSLKGKPLSSPGVPPLFLAFSFFLLPWRWPASASSNAGTCHLSPLPIRVQGTSSNPILKQKYLVLLVEIDVTHHIRQQCLEIPNNYFHSCTNQRFQR